MREGAPAEVDTLWHLAYVQNNNLMYASFRLNSAGYPELRRTETVAMGYDGVYIRKPSIGINNTSVVVSWQEDYWEFPKSAAGGRSPKQPDPPKRRRVASEAGNAQNPAV